MTVGLDERGLHVGEARDVEHPSETAADESVGAALLRRGRVEFAVAVECLAVWIAEMAAEIDILDDDDAAWRQRLLCPVEQGFGHRQMRQHEANVDEAGLFRRPLL